MPYRNHMGVKLDLGAGLRKKNINNFKTWVNVDGSITTIIICGN